MKTGKKAFTLVELLVVISIIALLLAVLIPALSRAKLIAERVICATHIKDISTAFLTYASLENNGKLPIGAMGVDPNLGDTPYFDGSKWSSLNYITQPTWLALTKYVKDTRTMICPGFAKTKDCKNDPLFKGEPWVPTGSTWKPPAYKIGYNYHGGHFAEKWAPDSRDVILKVKAWTSPYRVTDKGDLTLFSDMITMCDKAYGTFISHSARGSITGNITQDPLKLSYNSGGEIGKLDGSVKWKALKDMDKHHRTKNFGTNYAVDPYTVIMWGWW